MLKRTFLLLFGIPIICLYLTYCVVLIISAGVMLPIAYVVHNDSNYFSNKAANHIEFMSKKLDKLF